VPSSSRDSNNTTFGSFRKIYDRVIHYKEDIVKFWTAKTNEMPELFERAQMANTHYSRQQYLPATTVHSATQILYLNIK